MAIERQRVLSFSFIGADGVATRDPSGDVVSLTITGRGEDGGQSVTITAGQVERSAKALMWYGLKQKISDFRCDEKTEMTGAERLAAISECVTMLGEGLFNRERGERASIVPTFDEVVEAIQRIAGLAGRAMSLEDASRMVSAKGGDFTKLAPAVKDMIRSIRAEARVEKAGKATGDISELLG